MKHTVNLTWLDNMAFETELDGHKLTIDAAPGAGEMMKVLVLKNYYCWHWPDVPGWMWSRYYEK